MRLDRSSKFSLTVERSRFYALLTPLALFTLDTGSWETRNHEQTVPEGSAVPEIMPDRVSEQIVMTAPSPALTTTGSFARANSQAQLPAA